MRRELRPLARAAAAYTGYDGYGAQTFGIVYQIEILAQHLRAQIALQVVGRFGVRRLVGQVLGAAHDALLEKRFQYDGGRARIFESTAPLGGVGEIAAAYDDRVSEFETREFGFKIAHSVFLR